MEHQRVGYAAARLGVHRSKTTRLTELGLMELVASLDFKDQVRDLDDWYIIVGPVHLNEIALIEVMLWGGNWHEIGKYYPE